MFVEEGQPLFRRCADASGTAASSPEEGSGGRVHVVGLVEVWLAGLFVTRQFFSQPDFAHRRASLPMELHEECRRHFM